MAKNYAKFGKTQATYKFKRRKTIAKLPFVKSKLPALERVVEGGERVWMLDDKVYASLDDVVRDHIHLFPQYAQVLTPPPVAHDPALDANAELGEWECDCEEEYIRTKEEEKCEKCGAVKGEADA